MITRNTRPLTPNERAMLAPKGSGPPAQAFLLGMFVLAPIMLGYALLCRFFASLGRLERTPWALPLFIAPSVYFGTRMYLREKRRRDRRRCST